MVFRFWSRASWRSPRSLTQEQKAGIAADVAKFGPNPSVRAFLAHDKGWLTQPLLGGIAGLILLGIGSLLGQRIPGELIAWGAGFLMLWTVLQIAANYVVVVRNFQAYVRSLSEIGPHCGRDQDHFGSGKL